jgi:flagellar biosynthesis/type III secretory pathway protein FliH
MTPLNIPIVYLKGAVPPEPIIRASELMLYFDTASVLEQARREAERLIESANEAVAHAAREAESIRAQAREEGIADARRELQAKRAELVDETVQWCVDENQIEMQIADRMEQQIRGIVSQALAEFAAEQNSLEPLMRRIRAKLQQCAEHRVITLRVAHDALDSAKAVCLGIEHGHRIHVQTDSTLKAAQAIIETQYVKIRIDLDLHLQSVLSRLCDSIEEA